MANTKKPKYLIRFNAEIMPTYEVDDIGEHATGECTFIEHFAYKLPAGTYSYLHACSCTYAPDGSVARAEIQAHTREANAKCGYAPIYFKNLADASYVAMAIAGQIKREKKMKEDDKVMMENLGCVDFDVVEAKEEEIIEWKK